MYIFIGYDKSEEEAYKVCEFTIRERASKPVIITPLGLDRKPREYTRPRGPHDSTDFSNIRFLVPYLCKYEGQAIFIDCDMVVQDDICKLFDNTEEAVYVVKHDYIPKSAEKFLGNSQATYARKNWSSLMVFNNDKCRALTLDYVNEAPGLDLHQFMWTDSIGELPLEWNWLVGEYEDNYSAKILHYTLGGPWFDNYQMAVPWLLACSRMSSKPS